MACFAEVASANPTSGLSSNRFLFIVDQSAGMKPIDTAARQTVFDLIFSGVRGKMTNGDTYGIWVINEKNDTSFPMDIWKSKHAVEMAARAALHVKERPFKGRARLDVAMEDAIRVVKNVQDVTLILISNGETPISGTPFDAAINAQFRELVLPMKKAKSTLNLALVARDGELVAWAINAPQYLVEVPYVAPKPKPVEVPVAKVTNAPAPEPKPVAQTNPTRATAVSTQAAPLRPRAAAPIVITKSTVEQERRVYQAMTAAASIAADPIPQSEPETSAVPAAATNLLVATTTTNPPAGPAPNAPTNPTPVVVSIAPPPTNPSFITQATALASLTSNAAALARPAQPDGNVPLASGTTRSEAPARVLHPVVWLALGACLALAGVLTVLLVIRSRRQEPSLISQAIAQERLRQPQLQR